MYRLRFSCLHGEDVLRAFWSAGGRPASRRWTRRAITTSTSSTPTIALKMVPKMERSAYLDGLCRVSISGPVLLSKRVGRRVVGRRRLPARPSWFMPLVKVFVGQKLGFGFFGRLPGGEPLSHDSAVGLRRIGHGILQGGAGRGTLGKAWVVYRARHLGIQQGQHLGDGVGQLSPLAQMASGLRRRGSRADGRSSRRTRCCFPAG